MITFTIPGKQMGEALKFVVVLTENKYTGFVFAPYLVEVYPARYAFHTSLLSRNIASVEYPFNEREKEIVRLAAKCSKNSLAAKFSRGTPADTFFTTISPVELNKVVIPYVQKQMYRIGRLLMASDTPLFERNQGYSGIYDEDAVSVTGEFARIIFSFALSEEGTDYHISLFQGNKEIKIFERNVKFVTADPCMLVAGHHLHIFERVDARKIQPFVHREFIRIAKPVELKYFGNFVSQIVRDHEVQASGFTVSEEKIRPHPVISLEKDLRLLPVIVIKFRYDGTELLPADSRRILVSLKADGRNYHFRKIVRDLSAEARYIEILTQLGLKEEQGCYSFPNISLVAADEAIRYLVNWFCETQNRLTELGFEIRQGVLEKRYFMGPREMTFNIQRKSDWFDVFAVARIGEFNFPFIKLRKNILNGIRELELPNGEIAVLPEEWFERYRQVAEFAKGEGNLLNFQRHHYNLIRHTLNTLQPEAARLLEKTFNRKSHAEPPGNLKAQLRKYQLTGYQWLHQLHTRKMGGCLADDMGLGKTMQVLALLLKLKKNTAVSSVTRKIQGQLSLFDSVAPVQPASLIVVPTSLVHNWVNEINKFAPDLKVYRYTGNQRDIESDATGVLNHYDVVLSTYGTVRNDVEILKTMRFFYVILDESQYIKNPASKTCKAVMELNSDYRIVMTGTPVENSLSDLWTQMNFLNKGLLGTLPFFRQNYIIPVEAKESREVTGRLQLLIRPFILRRTKSEVAGDLPPVMEQVIYCGMTDEQQSAYEREKSLVRNAILANMETGLERNTSVMILRALMRLRQLANHPKLAASESDDESGKFNEIFQVLRSLVAEHHRVLIFSSFVTHLNLIKAGIEIEKWPYCLLTGNTQNREEEIRKFQEDENIPLFLISMKAGGVGLNLTAADYIFIVDPWWNPAVEDQAVSRAHRIGQKKSVFVYRFITENSIEEKIQILKERKGSLADRFINRNDPFRQVTKEEMMELFG